MRNIIKKCFAIDPTCHPVNNVDWSMDETPALIAGQQRIPRWWLQVNEKRKLLKGLVASSLDSSEKETGRQEKKKRKIDHAKEA